MFVLLGCIYAWKKPLKETLKPLMQAHEIGLLTGDLEFSALNANLYCFNKMWSGSTLGEVEADVFKFCNWMVARQQDSALTIAKPCLHLIHALMGKSPESSEIRKFGRFRDDAEKKSNFIVTASVCKEQMILDYLFGRYREAADKFIEYQKGAPPNFSVVQALCFKGLVCLALARQGIQRRKNIRTARLAIKRLGAYAQKSPHNYSDKLFLLEGELASVLGHADEAYQKFTCAIGMAAASNFSAIHALALERVGWHVFRQPNADYSLAETYFDEACQRYEEWGAYAKVEHLKNEISSLFAPMKLGLATTGMDLLPTDHTSSGSIH